ncbi:MAG TPA: hypothetical protein VGK89_08020 [Candidatus Eisenbacteria bacterium]|jgi:hypothetical protein
MPQHRATFTKDEWSALRVLVDHLRRAEPKDRERLREGMRGLGFYISDFEKAESRFVLSDLDRLVQMGEIKVVG